MDQYSTQRQVSAISQGELRHIARPQVGPERQRLRTPGAKVPPLGSTGSKARSRRAAGELLGAYWMTYCCAGICARGKRGEPDPKKLEYRGYPAPLFSFATCPRSFNRHRNAVVPLAQSDNGQDSRHFDGSGGCGVRVVPSEFLLQARRGEVEVGRALSDCSRATSEARANSPRGARCQRSHA